MDLAVDRRLALLTGTKEPDISEAGVLADILNRRAPPTTRSGRGRADGVDSMKVHLVNIVALTLGELDD